MQNDKILKWMRLALSLSLRARGQTFPNPLVGALVVKADRLIGRGYHRRAGEPHAEIIALEEAGRRARGSALICTLEPCVHVGRTGPCADAVIASGVREVYVGIKDPNPLVRGRGLERMRRSGIRVHCGFLEKEISLVNDFFICSMKLNRPLVTIKSAQSFDGKIATRLGESKWITSGNARRYSRRRRRFFDALMVGVNTVIADDPLLNASGKPVKVLTKIVVDSTLRVPLESRLFFTHQPVIVVCAKEYSLKAKRLRSMGVEVLCLPSVDKRVDLRALLGELHSRQLRSILVEGGAELIGSFLDAQLADRAMIYLAAKLIGGKQALGSVGGRGAAGICEAVEFKETDFKRIGSDYFFEGSLRYPSRGRNKGS